MSDIEAYLEANDARHLEELFEFLRIPSISTDPAHTDDMRRCAAFLVSQLEGLGFDAELVETGGHPIVLAEWLGAEGAPTVLYYGHYDVQPVDPLELWNTPPFEPTIIDGAVVARGASDDKGQVFAHLKALEALMAGRGRLPVNLRFILEGEEEIGSAHLEPFLKAHRERLQGDVVLVSDTTMFAPGIPSIVYGLRGLAFLEVHVRGPRRDLHSGSFGGAVENPANALCHILADLKDRQGRILIPGFYDDVLDLSDDERRDLAALPFDEEALLGEVGSRAHGEPGYSTLERIGARPSLDINGVWGGFTGSGAKTILPAEAHAKVSMRLVPNQHPEDISQKAAAFIRELAPESVDVSVDIKYGSPPSLTNRDSPFVEAAGRALERVFGRGPLFVREGGSIPVVGAFKRLLGLDTLLVGFGLSDDRIHSPNEKFELANFRSAMRFAVHFWPEVARIRG